VEGPDQLAGPGVEGAGQAFGVVLLQGWEPSLKDEPIRMVLSTTVRRRVQADLAGGEIDLLVDAGLANHAGIGANFRSTTPMIAELSIGWPRVGVDFSARR